MNSIPSMKSIPSEYLPDNTDSEENLIQIDDRPTDTSLEQPDHNDLDHVSNVANRSKVSACLTSMSISDAELKSSIETGDKIVKWLRDKYPGFTNKTSCRTTRESIKQADAIVEWLRQKLLTDSMTETDDEKPRLQSSSATEGDSTADSEEQLERSRKLHMTRAQLNERQGYYDKAADELKAAIQFEIRLKGDNNLDVAKTYIMLGRSYQRVHNEDEALQAYRKVLQIYSNCGLNEEGSPDLYWKIYDYMGDAASDWRKERDYYLKAIDILTKYVSTPPERLAHIHFNVGNTSYKLGELNMAKEHTEKAKEMMTITCDEFQTVNPEHLAKTRSRLGTVYQDLALFDDAIVELEASAKMREEMTMDEQTRTSIGHDHHKLSEIYKQLENQQKQKYHEAKALESIKPILGMTDEELSQHSLPKLLAKALQLTTDSGDPLSEVQEEIAKAMSSHDAGQHQMSITHYEKAIQLIDDLPPGKRSSRKAKKMLAQCHNNIGNDHRQLNQFPEAEKHFDKALALRTDLYGNEASGVVASTLYNLGHLYSQMGGKYRAQDVIRVHKECLDMYLKMGGLMVPEYEKWIIGLNRSLGGAYHSIGDNRKSVLHYKEARRIIEDKGHDLEQLQAVCNNLGNSYKSLHDQTNAEECLVKAVELAENMVAFSSDGASKQQMRNNVAASCNNLGILYQNMKKFDDSIRLLQKSRDIRIELAYKAQDTQALVDLPSSFHNLGNTYAKMSRYSEALECFNEEKRVRQDLNENLMDVDMCIATTMTNLGRFDEAEAILAQYNK